MSEGLCIFRHRDSNLPEYHRGLVPAKFAKFTHTFRLPSSE